MISIGAYYYGPELQGSKINRLIMRASKVLKELGAVAKSDGTPWVNVVFVVSGSLNKVEFQGLEYGDYSKRDKGIVVKIAISHRAMEGGDLASYLVDSLHGANAMAFEFFRQKGEDFPLREAEDLIARAAIQLRDENHRVE